MKKVHTKTQTIPFVEARKLLHTQIDNLTGEDLAEVLATIRGDDDGTFNAQTGTITLYQQVITPHCRVYIRPDPPLNHATISIHWINQDNACLKTDFIQDEGDIYQIYDDGSDTKITAEDLIRHIAKHFGLTIQ